MEGKKSAVTASKFGALGLMACNRSAEPDVEDEARFPCLLKSKSDEARIEDVVETLNVKCPSPPVPTISHSPPSYVPSPLPRNRTTSLRACPSNATAAFLITSAHCASVFGSRSCSEARKRVRKLADWISDNWLVKTNPKAAAISLAVIVSFFGPMKVLRRGEMEIKCCEFWKSAITIYLKGAKGPNQSK